MRLHRQVSPCFHCQPTKRTNLTIEPNSLPESKDDRSLEAAITREFGQFGTVFVKIRREMKGGTTGMPYAFAQYTVSCPSVSVARDTADNKQNDADANVAVEGGKGIMILGRPCRTEMVKANRECRVPFPRPQEFHADTGLAPQLNQAPSSFTAAMAMRSPWTLPGRSSSRTVS